MRPSKSFLLAMPVTWSRSCPFLKKSNAGMARMLYLNERLWFSSTFTFATLIASAFSRAISSSNGAIILQGPHHSAQKSTITGLLLWVTSRSKLDSSRLMVAELSIALGKVSPNLNNQNHGRSAEQHPAQGHCTFLCWRHRNRSSLWGSVRHGDERLSFFHLNRG